VNKKRQKMVATSPARNPAKAGNLVCNSNFQIYGKK